VDTEWAWHVDWLGKDFVSRELGVVGGKFGDGRTGPALPAGLKFYADIPAALPSPVAGLAGRWMHEGFPSGLELKANATGKIALDKGAAPKRSGAAYDYDVTNPSTATLTYTAKTWLFKGARKLYYDNADASQHKVVSVAYTGVMVPLGGGKFSGLGAGTVTLNKQKIGVPVEIR